LTFHFIWIKYAQYFTKLKRNGNRTPQYLPGYQSRTFPHERRARSLLFPQGSPHRKRDSRVLQSLPCSSYASEVSILQEDRRGDRHELDDYCTYLQVPEVRKSRVRPRSISPGIRFKIILYSLPKYEP
jgi:hypothetical protein